MFTFLTKVSITCSHDDPVGIKKQGCPSFGMMPPGINKREAEKRINMTINPPAGKIHLISRDFILITVSKDNHL